MLICRAAEIKEGLFGEENFSLSNDGKIENYTFEQFGAKESTKINEIDAIEQLKTPLQESVEEIQHYQKENDWSLSEKPLTTKSSIIMTIIGVLSVVLGSYICYLASVLKGDIKAIFVFPTMILIFGGVCFAIFSFISIFDKDIQSNSKSV